MPHLDWPGVAQVGRIEREREIRGQTSREVAYAVTSLTREQAGPEALLSLVRGHWAIENQLHWRRDVSLREDACRVRSGCAPQALAALRNTVLRLARALPGPLAAVRETLGGHCRARALCCARDRRTPCRRGRRDSRREIADRLARSCARMLQCDRRTGSGKPDRKRERVALPNRNSRSRGWANPPMTSKPASARIAALEQRCSDILVSALEQVRTAQRCLVAPRRRRLAPQLLGLQYLVAQDRDHNDLRRHRKERHGVIQGTARRGRGVPGDHGGPIPKRPSVRRNEHQRPSRAK